MENNILRVEHIFHSFKKEGKREKTQTLHDISFSVARGEFVSLIGPSGCGKSTFLKIVAGLTLPTHGEVDDASSCVAMVFQNFAVFPWLSVLENVEFGLRMAGMKKENRRAIALEKISEVKLSGFEDKHVGELSGGMRQRVGVARALAVSPDLLLMDEPFASLDELTASELRRDLLDVWHRYKMTVVMVTHLVEEAISLSDRVVIFSARPATVKKIISITSPRPRKTRTEEYFTLVDAVTAEIER